MCIILIYSVIKVTEKYCPQIFLEKCKYAIKKENIINTIKEQLNLIESDDESNNEKSSESNESDEYNKSDED